MRNLIFFGGPYLPLNDLKQKHRDPCDTNNGCNFPQKLPIDFGSVQIIPQKEQARTVDDQRDQNRTKNVSIHVMNSGDHIQQFEEDERCECYCDDADKWLLK